jgi:predicted nucleic acid-binding protein
MRGKYFLDTNIFVYGSISHEPAKKKLAEELISGALEDLAGIVSWQVIQEFLNVALRPPNLMPVVLAERYIGLVFQPLLQVYPSPPLYAEALHLKQRYQFGWHDSLIVASALEGGCEVLYTEDLQHGMRVGDLTIVDPFRGADAPPML